MPLPSEPGGSWETGILQVIDFILDNAGDVNLCNSRGYSALHRAVANNNIKAVRRLLEHEAILNQGEDEMHIVYTAVDNNASPVLVRLLFRYLEKTPNYLELLNINAYQIVREAIFDTQRGVFEGREAPDLIEFLLGSGIDYERKVEYDGSNPFLRAVSEGAVEAVRLFLRQGVDVFVGARSGETALDLVCETAEDQFGGNAAEIRSLLNAAGLVDEEEVDGIEMLAESQSETVSTGYYKTEDDMFFYEDAGDLDSSPACPGLSIAVHARRFT